MSTCSECSKVVNLILSSRHLAVTITGIAIGQSMLL